MNRLPQADVEHRYVMIVTLAEDAPQTVFSGNDVEALLRRADDIVRMRGCSILMLDAETGLTRVVYGPMAVPRQTGREMN